MNLIPAWWRLFLELDQLGPGSEESTLRALQGLGALPDAPRILDMGCGSGRQTRVLASHTNATILALDLLAPFLRQLVSRFDKAGFSHRIQPLQGNMSQPAIAAESVDLIWSEGAIYIPGFETGLRLWRELLVDGGRAAISELSWVSQPPTETRRYWENAYPSVADVDTNCNRARRAGFEVLSTFELPLEDWHAYYDPIEARAANLRPEFENDPASLDVLSEHLEEVRILESSRGSYTYVFYLLRKS